jgi:hypothetical protein
VDITRQGKDEHYQVEFNVHGLEIVDWTKDEGKKDFEVPRAREKVKRTEVLKAKVKKSFLQEIKVDQAKKRHGVLKTTTY